MAKAKNPKYTTPAGIAVYPSLNKPDEYNGKVTGFKVDLEMSREDAQPLIDAIEKQMKVVHKQLCEETGKKINIAKLNRPYFDHEEKDGVVVIRCKQNHEINGEPVRIIFFDAKGNRIENPPLVRGGSKLKVAGTLYGYGGAQKGLKLTISAVQIIELAEGGDASADQFGFGEEDGFEADHDDDAPFDTDGEDEGFEDEDDDEDF